MALTDAKVKSAKVEEGKKQSKLSDGWGLYLLVKPSGKYWRLDYSFCGKRKTLSIGVYSDVTLKQAREARESAKKLLRNNIDPNQAKQAEKRKVAVEAMAQKFEGVALDMIRVKSPKWTVSTKNGVINRFEKHVFPWIGSLPIKDIKAPDLLAVLRRVENTGCVETAHKLRTSCGQVFRFGIAAGLLDYDPTQSLEGALTPKMVTHRACLKDGKAVGGLMRAIKGFNGTLVVACALKLSPLVFVRPGELRQAEWVEIDLDAKLWTIPAEKMKMRCAHIVPLSSQAIAILEEIRPLTGGGKFVFPNIRKPSRSMSENTINNALQRMGYDTKTEQCAHGFRGTASTLLRSLQYPHDVIETQLAHKTGSEVSRAYNHYNHLPERITMMQGWADYLDALRDGADVIPIKRTA